MLMGLSGCALGAAHVLLLDGLDGTVARVVLGEDTEFAPGYTDASFRRVREAMAAPEVEALLGVPLERRRGVTPDDEAWWYTRSRRGSHHRQRIVVFNHGRVSEVIHEFWVD
jgi:hypothetical protein